MYCWINFWSILILLFYKILTKQINIVIYLNYFKYLNSNKKDLKIIFICFWKTFNLLKINAVSPTKLDTWQKNLLNSVTLGKNWLKILSFYIQTYIRIQAKITEYLQKADFE